MNCPDQWIEIAKEGRSWVELIAAIFLYHCPQPKYIRKKDDSIGKPYFDKNGTGSP